MNATSLSHLRLGTEECVLEHARTYGNPPTSGSRRGYQRRSWRVCRACRLILIQDRVVPTKPTTRRRPQWRGERKAVLVRLPVTVAAQLAAAAQESALSVSEHAGGLIAAALAERTSA